MEAICIQRAWDGEGPKQCVDPVIYIV